MLKALGDSRLQEAATAYAACLATREQALGQQHPDTAIALLGGPLFVQHCPCAYRKLLVVLITGGR